MPKLPFGKSSRPRVYVTRDLPGDAINRLREHADVDVWHAETPPPREDILRGIETANALLCLLTDNVDAGVIEAGPRLRIVSTMAVGYDHIDVAACTRGGIFVTNTPGVLTETTADFTFALMLAAARRLPEAERAVREGRWTTWHPTFLAGRDVGGATLGIVGMGAIGAAVARRARGFDMRVLYYNRTQRLDDHDLGITYAPFERLLEESDYVTVHTPLTADTRHMFNDEAFERMKTSAIFINTARGAVVDESALLRALEGGKIAGAAIDVAEVEPIPKTDMLLRIPNILVTPHIASASVATRQRMAAVAVDNVIEALDGKTPPNCVNAEGLSGA
jgi:glyoxylate reductase